MKKRIKSVVRCVYNLPFILLRKYWVWRAIKEGAQPIGMVLVHTSMLATGCITWLECMYRLSKTNVLDWREYKKRLRFVTNISTGRFSPPLADEYIRGLATGRYVEGEPKGNRFFSTPWRFSVKTMKASGMIGLYEVMPEEEKTT